MKRISHHLYLSFAQHLLQSKYNPWGFCQCVPYKTTAYRPLLIQHPTFSSPVWSFFPVASSKLPTSRLLLMSNSFIFVMELVVQARIPVICSNFVVLSWSVPTPLDLLSSLCPSLWTWHPVERAAQATLTPLGLNLVSAGHSRLVCNPRTNPTEWGFHFILMFSLFQPPSNKCPNSGCSRCCIPLMLILLAWHRKHCGPL